MCLKTHDIDLDLQGQIETEKFCAVPCATTFEQFQLQT